jgi:hypothetical protein
VKYPTAPIAVVEETGVWFFRGNSPRFGAKFALQALILTQQLAIPCHFGILRIDERVGRDTSGFLSRVP